MIHFTSDLHFGHQNIIEYCNRPFSSVDEMNEAIIDNWNSVVGSGDVVWVLGDVAMGKIAETLPLVSRLNGIKALVYGNHDRMFNPKKYAEWKEKYREVGFDEICKSAYINLPTVNQHRVVLNHFPYTGDSGDEDRFVKERPTDNGMWLLHGHVHDSWKQRGRMINVGCDVWDYTPVSMDTIVAMIEQGENDA